MSKSLNLFLPALGVTGLVLGAAYGLATRGYKADEAEAAMAAAEAAKARVEAQQAENLDLQTRIETVQAEAEARLADMQAIPAGGTAFSAPAPVADSPYGLGREAEAAEIAAWDVDVLPDGRGLPEGSGDVLTGEDVFAEKCGSCHGDFAEGVGNWPVLAGGFNTLANKDPVKTVGSYWPYLSTVWDYVHRSMPFGEAQTLTADETYAITAYILYSNDLVDEDFVLSRETFQDVEMHNADGFIIDDRPEVEYPVWRGKPCMENCKDSVEITMRATRLKVTPIDEFMHPVMRGESVGQASAELPAATVQPEETGQEATGEALDADLVAAGEKAFRRCKSCHQIGEAAKNRTGPHLNGILGRTVGGLDGFSYSGAFKEAALADEAWTEESLTAFLANPKAARPGTKMSFAGVKTEAEIAAILAYLQANGG